MAMIKPPKILTVALPVISISLVLVITFGSGKGLTRVIIVITRTKTAKVTAIRFRKAISETTGKN